MGIVRFVVWITFSFVFATIVPLQNSPTMSLAQETLSGLSGAATSFGAAATDTYREFAHIKTEFLGFLLNILGRSMNGVGTTLDLANSGVGAVRSYSETGTGYVVDTAQTGLKSASTAVGSAGESVKSYGSGLINLPATASAQTKRD